MPPTSRVRSRSKNAAPRGMLTHVARSRRPGVASVVGSRRCGWVVRRAMRTERYLHLAGGPKTAEGLAGGHQSFRHASPVRGGGPETLHRGGQLGGTSAPSCRSVVSITLSGAEQSVNAISADICYRSQRWIESSSEPSWRWPSTGRSPRPPRPWARCSPTSPHTSAASSRELGRDPHRPVHQRAHRRRDRRCWSGPGASRREFNALDSDLAYLRDVVVGSVRLGVIGTTARWLVPPLLQRLWRGLPRGPGRRARRTRRASLVLETESRHASTWP